jgi:hypothetical protein
MLRRAGVDATVKGLHYVAPVGEKEAYVDKLISTVRAFIPPDELLL